MTRSRVPFDQGLSPELRRYLERVERIANNAMAEATSPSGAAAQTGDVQLTFATVAPDGWVMIDDGSIGDAGSGATTRANADCEALYTLLYDNISDTHAPVSGGRGASATEDFAAGKTLTLTKMLGRALGIAGSGTGLTSRALGLAVGVEDQALTVSQLPVVTPAGTVSRPNVNAKVDAVMTTGDGLSFPGVVQGGSDDTSLTSLASDPEFTGTPFGGDEAHNNMQPTTFLNARIKL